MSYRTPDIIYLPATKDRPPEPAPFLLTGDEVLRMTRQDRTNDPDSALKRLREKGWLRATKIGTRLVYALPDVLRCFEMARQDDPR